MSWSVKVVILTLAALGATLYFLGPILTPFVISAALAYVGDPLVDRLERLRLSRTLAVTLVFIALAAILLPILIVLLPILADQVRVFVGNLPDYLDWIVHRGLPAIGLRLPPELQFDAAKLKQVVAKNLPEAGGAAVNILSTLSKSGGALLAFFAGLLLIPVVTFYLLRDWDRLVAAIDVMLPARMRATVRELARDTDSVLGGFMRGQLLVMTALATLYSVGLWIAGLNLALLIGIGAGLVSFVPYLGFIVGLLAASIAALVQMQDSIALLYVFIVFMIGQIVESAWLTPWLVGDRIGLHPVAVIFAVMAGGHLFGFVGVLLALPAAAIIAVLVRHAFAHWRESAAFQKP